MDVTEQLRNEVNKVVKGQVYVSMPNAFFEWSMATTCYQLLAFKKKPNRTVEDIGEMNGLFLGAKRQLGMWVQRADWMMV